MARKPFSARLREFLMLHRGILVSILFGSGGVLLNLALNDTSDIVHILSPKVFEKGGVWALLALRIAPYIVWPLLVINFYWWILKWLIEDPPLSHPRLGPAGYLNVLAECDRLRKAIIAFDRLSEAMSEATNDPHSKEALERLREAVQRLKEPRPSEARSQAATIRALREVIETWLEEFLSGTEEGHLADVLASLFNLISEGLQRREGHVEMWNQNGSVQLYKANGNQTLDPVPETFSSIAIGSSCGVEHILEAVIITDGKQDTTGIEEALGPDVVSKGSKVLRKRFKMRQDPNGKVEFDRAQSQQIIRSMKPAYIADNDCTLQLGPFATLNYTVNAGLRMWILEEDWTPAIYDCRRSWSVWNLLTGKPAEWIVRGFNLRDITVLKAATENQTEIMRVIKRSYEIASGLHVLICEEPSLIQNLAPSFKSKVIISASQLVAVEEGATFNLQSEAMNVPKAYWISVVDGFIPSPFTVIAMASLFLFGCLCLDMISATHSLLTRTVPLYMDLPLGHNSNILAGVHLFERNFEGPSASLNDLELSKFFRVHLTRNICMVEL